MFEWLDCQGRDWDDSRANHTHFIGPGLNLGGKRGGGSFRVLGFRVLGFRNGQDKAKVVHGSVRGRV